ncbi:hypothetical protein DAA51_00100 [Bradyrhizobium sp. WBAH10]|nr:hypothetical protein [Bradyrhizobium sp. WBAH30]MDD1546202.1 hypothetical protein [Bradyrhizobium sp. WBAH41]MDD1560082.1 hypothetical protein [Bradyrhizobium sp. WBAH23]MDD1567185.1 hypothetical protein [Bradyrhizobium sp. WBAH33]MDD1593492.1 hypothetical protein [Bradyrhizobium sp. WBAH42]NRB90693.1 hypothetical protein [Bradyrhizobium sp. WBAH10]QCJ87087.1 hypothetical protein DAA57_00020 [Bradyrhizobium yuanmingense]
MPPAALVAVPSALPPAIRVKAADATLALAARPVKLDMTEAMVAPAAAKPDSEASPAETLSACF